MTEPTICVVGSSNMDLISYGFGGKGANQAVAAGLLGAHVSMVCKLGQDTFGTDMVKNFKTRGVDTEHILITNQASSGVAAINVAKNGENNIIIVSGANDLLTPQEVQAARPLIKKSKILMTQLEILLPTTLEALKIGKQEGLLTILNTAPAQDLPDEIFQYVDILSPNETELELLSHKPVTNIEEAKAAAGVLLAKGAKQVLVTLGKNGSLLVTPTSSFHAPIETPVVPLDTTGAGDCFLGSFAYFLGLGKDDIHTCMAKANKVAAISVTREGTQTSFPTKDEVRQKGIL